MTKKTIFDVQHYWDEHPIGSYELSLNNLEEFYAQFDEIKRNDIEKYAFDFFDFNNFANKKILDIGCGAGWYSIQYAKGNANVYAIDLSSNTIKNTKIIIDNLGLNINLEQGNAEKLNFPDNYFDLVISNGVLHHTPDYKEAIKETYRVLKPGSLSKLTFYRKGILHNRYIWPILRNAMHFLKIKHPGSDLSVTSRNVDDFIRQYDGYSNPVGIGKTNAAWAKIMKEANYQILLMENHFFPKRFIPFNKYIPEYLHKVLDKKYGTMVYFNLLK